jgi:hypothetical protein
MAPVNAALVGGLTITAVGASISGLALHVRWGHLPILDDKTNDGDNGGSDDIQAVRQLSHLFYPAP